MNKNKKMNSKIFLENHKEGTGEKKKTGMVVSPLKKATNAYKKAT